MKNETIYIQRIILITCVHQHVSEMKLQTEEHSVYLSAWTCTRSKIIDKIEDYLCAWTCIRNETTDKQRIVLFTCLHEHIPEMKLQTDGHSVHLCAWTYTRNETTEDHSVHLYLKWNYRQTDGHSVHLCAWTYTRNETTNRITCVHELASKMKLQIEDHSVQLRA